MLVDQDPRTVARVTVYDPGLDLGTSHSAHVLVTTRAASTSDPVHSRLQAAAYRREITAVKHIGLFGALRCR
ncbi:hypothetical protein [Actinophytocola sp. NPDC049390]|uniref:hypothetical protein n=1 Tax=Actinophytocola sp. NPDC049390 TaxID=3363894 RepID=UPI0037AE3368